MAVISNHTQKHHSTPHYSLMETTLDKKKAYIPLLTCGIFGIPVLNLKREAGFARVCSRSSASARAQEPLGSITCVNQYSQPLTVVRRFGSIHMGWPSLTEPERCDEAPETARQRPFASGSSPKDAPEKPKAGGELTKLSPLSRPKCAEG